MALALYRKYRPASFADVVGQEHVTEPLRTALASGRVNHAYLFSGPRGCGKTSSARILARSLNCELGPTPDPCGACPSCIALAPEGSGNVDVIELDAASHGGVDDARELRDRAFYAPAESRYRVFIVDEAHMVTTQGFNALLKIVEEPPEHLVFVFATTEPDKVLPTIRSRTHHYPFRLIPPGTLRALLERICADEGAVVAPAVFPLVIRAGGGSARDTLSVLDQLLAGAGEEGVTYERAVSLLGVTDVALIDDTVDALAAQDAAAVFETVDRLVEAGHDPRRFAADLLDRLRDLILIAAVPDAASRGLVDAPGDELSRMTDQAARLGSATLSRFAEIVHTGLTDMRGATAPRLLLELLFGRMLLPAASLSDAALLQRLERMERRASIAPEPVPAAAAPPAASAPPGASASPGASAGPAAPAVATAEPASAPSSERPRHVRPSQVAAEATSRAADAPRAADSSHPEPRSSRPEPPAPSHAAAGPSRPEPSRAEPSRAEPSREGASASPAAADAQPVAAPAPESAAEPATGGGIDATAVRRAWPEVLEQAKQTSRSTGALLMNATVKAVDGDTLVLAIAAAPLARRLSEQRNTDVISAALRTVLGVAWRVRCEHDGAPAGGGSGTSGGSAPRPPAPPPAPAAGNGGGHRGGNSSAGNSSGNNSGRNSGGNNSGGNNSGGNNSGGNNSGGNSGGGQGQSAPSQPPASTRRVPSRPSPQDPPLPPEPPPDDEEEMLAEAHADTSGEPSSRRDPEEVAIELLSAQLGARAVDER